jgi:hypothetical protein
LGIVVLKAFAQWEHGFVRVRHLVEGGLAGRVIATGGIDR